ncbi:MAG: ABC transporter substrate-binding protein [Candidatus Binatia bacterium]
MVSLVPSVTETLFALGAGSLVVGVSDRSDLPAEAGRVARVGTFVSPLTEVVLALEPDLVITSPSPGNENSVRAMRRAGVSVLVVEDGRIEEVRRAVTEIAQALGRREQGGRLLERMAAEIAQARRLARGRGRPRVAAVVGRRPLVLAGPASYLGELVELAGGSNVAAPLGGAWPRVSWEFLLATSPEVILDLSMGDESATREELVERWERFDSMAAVASGRVYGSLGDLLLRPGPRLGEAALALARLFHHSSDGEER